MKIIVAIVALTIGIFIGSEIQVSLDNNQDDARQVQVLSASSSITVTAKFQ